MAETKTATSLIYVGGYTAKGGKGIYAFRFNSQTGELTPLDLAAETPNPSYFVLHPNGKYLYAVSFTGPSTGPRIGFASAFAIDPASSKLNFINQQSTGGGGPARITIDKAGTHVMVANYGTGSIAVLPVEADGSLGSATDLEQHTGTGPVQDRQEGPHAHSVVLDPANRFLFVCDLGIDKVMIYAYNAEQGELKHHGFAALPPGSGPRHITFSPDGKFAYVISELRSTLTVFHYDSSAGTLAEIQRLSTLPGSWTTPNKAAEVHAHPNGKFVYASNRGHDSIATFLTHSDGSLSLVGFTPCGGKTPRYFTLDSTATWLLCAHQDSNTLTIFKLNVDTGLPVPTSTISIPNPTCIAELATK